MLDDVYTAFDEEMRNCRRCADLFASYPVDPPQDPTPVIPRPIVSGVRPKPVMLIGQAPGLTEYSTGKPFQGGAGQAIRHVFADAGIPPPQFDVLVYSSAVIKCFPGSRIVDGPRREDVRPTAEMVANCNPFLQRQIQMVDPAVLVLLGRFPLEEYLRMTGRRSSGVRLQDFVGRREEWTGRTVIFLPHTSGTSRWHNSAENAALFQQAKNLLGTVLVERGVTGTGSATTTATSATAPSSARRPAPPSERANRPRSTKAVATRLSTGRRAEILRAAMQAMRDGGGEWTRDQLRYAVLARLTFTAEEAAPDSRGRPAWTMAFWELSPAKDRGWLANGGRDRWSLTPAGERALQDHPGEELIK